MSRVALVTAEIARDADDDETPLLDALIWSGVEASVVVWDDRKVDWSTFDLVVVRSTWDYALRHNEFVRWLRRVSLRSITSSCNRAAPNSSSTRMPALACAKPVPTAVLKPS